MSSVCGILLDKSKDQLLGRLETMLSAMSFRGGKNKTIYTEDGFGFGSFSSHKEIAVNETGEIMAVMDGEIYNSSKIADTLKSKGHLITDNSGLSIIPHLYEDHGLDFAATLNGNFVIAIYDMNHDRILLARDHMGCRSAFYFSVNGQFGFASTIKGLLASRLFSPTLSGKSINLYFAGTCVPHPYTMFEEVRSLRPGYVTEYRDGQVSEYEYWTLSNLEEDYRTSEQDFMEQIRSLCLDAIKIRAKNKESLGTVLSGGVDSSLIAAIVPQSQSSGRPLPAFSIGFQEAAYDDSSLQRLMLEKYNLAGHKAILTPNDVMHILSQVVKNSDYPLNNASAMGTWLCMQLAQKKGITRILDGEGADELFCGGGGVVGEHLVEFFERLPSWFRKVTFGFVGRSLHIGKTGNLTSMKRFCYRVVMPPIDRMLTWLPAFDRKTRKNLLSDDLAQYVDTVDELASGRSYMERARFKDGLNLYQYGACKTYLCDDLLFKNERMAAAHGIINRTPFVDYRLVELAFRIPARFKLTGYTTRTAEKKLIYRKAIQGLIPDEILWRKKMRGFSQPTEVWLRGPLKEFASDVLLGNKARERGIWNVDFAERMLKEHFEGLENRDRLLWGMITLELWVREFFDKIN